MVIDVWLAEKVNNVVNWNATNCVLHGKREREREREREAIQPKFR